MTELKITLTECINAYNYLSFNPEKKGKSLYNMFKSDFTDLLEKLKEVEKEIAETLDYKFHQNVSDYVSKLSLCVSTMITGQGNFNYEKANKKNEMFFKAQEKYFNFLNYNFIKKEKINFDTNIINLNQELADAIFTHQYLKINKDKRDHSFSLTYANNKVKNIKKKIDILMKIDNNTTNGQISSGKGFTAYIDKTTNRIAIKHDLKPTAQEISELKTKGFRWSPKNQVWQAYINQRSEYFAKNYKVS